MKTAQETLDQFDKFFDELIESDSIEIQLIVSAFCSPGLQITINSNIVYDNILSSGVHTINLSYKTDPKIVLDISMYGKSPKDTLVQNNQIIQDKFITIDGLTINNFDLFNDSDLFYNKFLYINNQGIEEQVKAGFWGNNTLRLIFTTPFALWHTQNSHKNTHISNSLHYRNNSLTNEVFEDLVKNIQLLT